VPAVAIGIEATLQDMEYIGQETGFVVTLPA